MPSEQSALWMRRFSKLIPLGLLLAVLAILVPAILHSREAARRTQSKNNLKQFFLALQNYNEAFITLPPGGTFDSNGNAHHSWGTFLDPYLSSDPWYTFVNFNLPWDDPKNVGVFLLGSYATKSLQNPSISAQCSSDGFRLIHYSANQRLMHRNSHVRLADITTGTSSTMLLGDSAGQYVPAGYPYNWRDVALGLHCESPGFGCPVRSSTMIAMADGTVRELNNRTDNAVLSHIAGPEELQPNPDRTHKPDHPYALKTARYWTFDWSSRGDKSLNTFRISPDETTLLISLGQIDPISSTKFEWTSRFLDEPKAANLESIEINGTLNAPELRWIWELPKLKRLDLSRAYVTGDVESILKEAPARITIER